MLKKIRDEKSPENLELQAAEYKIQIEPQQRQSQSNMELQDSIETVETSFVTTSTTGPTT